jgi:peptidoglycan/xylan/chitin deacetylase (PgdA/CDA1 family)
MRLVEKYPYYMNGLLLGRFVFHILKDLQLDALSRFLNRKRILILAYHGITARSFAVKPWILFPVESFEEQIRFLCSHYNIISLHQAVTAIYNGSQLREKPAVVTFDDGYRNNLTMALPVLKKYGVPATIFLTAGYIGTDKILPLDRAYLSITNARKKEPLMIQEIGLGPLFFHNNKAIAASYFATVAALKRFPTKAQEKYLDLLEDKLNPDYRQKEAYKEFQLLSWEEVRQLNNSKIIEIGAHTLSHEILSNVSNEEAEKEIVDSKVMIEHNLLQPIDSFAYPNGTDRDYNKSHISQLKKTGFCCSVTTTARLNQCGDDPYTLGRISVGPDFVNNLDQFVLKISGFNLAMKNVFQGCHG